MTRLRSRAASPVCDGADASVGAINMVDKVARLPWQPAETPETLRSAPPSGKRRALGLRACGRCCSPPQLRQSRRRTGSAQRFRRSPKRCCFTRLLRSKNDSGAVSERPGTHVKGVVLILWQVPEGLVVAGSHDLQHSTCRERQLTKAGWDIRAILSNLTAHTPSSQGQSQRPPLRSKCPCLRQTRRAPRSLQASPRGASR